MKGVQLRNQDTDRLKTDIERILADATRKIETIENSLKKEKLTPELRPRSDMRNNNFLTLERPKKLVEIENLKQDAFKKTELLLEHLPEKQQTEFREKIYERLYPGQKVPEKPQPHFTERTTVIDFTAAAQAKEKQPEAEPLTEEEPAQQMKGRFSRFLREQNQAKEPENPTKEKDEREPEP